MPRTKLSECGEKGKLLSVRLAGSALKCLSIFFLFSRAACRSIWKTFRIQFHQKRISKISARFLQFFLARFRIQFKVKKQSYSKILETSRKPEANWNNTYFISMFAILCWVLLEVTSPCLCTTRRHAIKFQFSLMPADSEGAVLELNSFHSIEITL